MRFRLARLLSALGLVSSITFAQRAPAPKPVGIDDLFGVREVHDPQISPDARLVAYTVLSSSLKEDKSETRIWMIPTAGGEARPLTVEGFSSNHPRWSPDGQSLAFLSARKDPPGRASKTQVYLLNRRGGEAQRLTDTIQDVEDFAWAADGQRMVLVLRDPTPEELEGDDRKGKTEVEGTEKLAAAREPKQQRPWIIDRLYFKEDTIGFLDRRRTHLYLFDVRAKTLTQITSGDFDDTEPAWSPDGKSLAFTSNRSQPDPDANFNTDIWVVDAGNTDKGAHLIQITTSLGEDDHPAWSPDGRLITYCSSGNPELFWYATKHVAVSPASGGEARLLTRSFDRMATVPSFAPDGKSVYFIADDDGTQTLCVVQLSDGKVSRVIAGRLTVEGYSQAKDGSLAAGVSTTDRPYELFTVPQGQLTRLTHTNDAWLAQFKLAQAEYVSFRSKDGTTVHGYLYKPLDYVPGRKYPAILRPHGGPVGEYEAEFRDLAQLFAANGYVVLFPNPRGSTGYGQDFCKAIFADWGNKDFQDDMAMVDFAIAQGLADPDKLGVGGHSYGAISTDFIIAQTTRFKAATSWAGAAEFTGLWGHDEYVKHYIYELGYPWENRAAWDHVATFWRVKDIHTPTLFLCGDIDWNVPLPGSEQLYESLKALGRETLLVVYPGESHEFVLPSHLKDRDERYLAWFAHYVKADGTPARPVKQKESREGN